MITMHSVAVCGAVQGPAIMCVRIKFKALLMVNRLWLGHMAAALPGAPHLCPALCKAPAPPVR